MKPESMAEPPDLAPDQIPQYVTTDAQRLRWRFSVGIARQLFSEAGGAAVWSAARAIYNDQSVPTVPSGPN
jgi:hypothetical protein